MTKAKLIYIVLAFFILSSCQDNNKQQASETPLLDDLRKDAQEEYHASKENIAKIIPTETRSVPCQKCDIKFLAKIWKKDNLTAEEFDNLICINKVDCENNVEFTEFYNEVLFASIDRNPQLFYKTVSKPELKEYKTRVFQELKNPIGDNLSTKKTMIKVQESIREVETRTASQELNLELNRELNRIINIRRE